MKEQHINTFIEETRSSLENHTLIKIIVSNKRIKSEDLKAVHFKPVLLKNQLHLNVVFRHETKDVTKNLNTNQAIDLLKRLLLENFFQAILLSTQADYNLFLRKDDSSSLKKSKASKTIKPELKHNHQKKRLIQTEYNIYLQALGVLNASGNINSNKQKKFKQINKYIEIMADLLTRLNFIDQIHITDMGSGKGYLSFALYDYLKNTLKKTPILTGIELRSNLVEKCNEIAHLAEYEHLKFVQGSIHDTTIDQLDVLIALHACDTATDDAIFRGIKTQAKAIVVAPCCHKQIRKQLNPPNSLKAITQFGILKERQAELLTDTLRALILETQGYKTKVFEFISTEHTSKNLLIVATKNTKSSDEISRLKAQIKEIKDSFGLDYHYLEKLIHADQIEL